MKTTRQKIEQCEGLLGTKDVSEWEGQFLSGLVERLANAPNGLTLSDKQLDVLDRIHGKHFA